MARTRKNVITKAALLESQAHYQETTCRFAWLVKQLAPAQGFYFIESPRGYQAIVALIDDDFNVGFYDFTAPNQVLANELYRQHRDGPWFDSLIDAFKSLSRYRAKHAVVSTAPAAANDGGAS